MLRVGSLEYYAASISKQLGREEQLNQRKNKMPGGNSDDLKKFLNGGYMDRNFRLPTTSLGVSTDGSASCGIKLLQQLYYTQQHGWIVGVSNNGELCEICRIDPQLKSRLFTLHSGRGGSLMNSLFPNGKGVYDGLYGSGKISSAYSHYQTGEIYVEVEFEGDQTMHYPVKRAFEMFGIVI